MVLFPPGEVLLWDFFPGEGLPFGTPSWGTFAIWYNLRGGGGAICHGICFLNMKFVWGGDLL